MNFIFCTYSIQIWTQYHSGAAPCITWFKRDLVTFFPDCISGTSSGPILLRNSSPFFWFSLPAMPTSWRLHGQCECQILEKELGISIRLGTVQTPVKIYISQTVWWKSLMCVVMGPDWLAKLDQYIRQLNPFSANYLTHLSLNACFLFKPISSFCSKNTISAERDYELHKS